VKSLQPGSEAKAVIANELGEEKETASDEKSKKSSDGNSKSKLSVHVGVKDGMLEVLADDKIVAVFPVTVGCIRLANWDVVKVAELVKPGVPVTVDDSSPIASSAPTTSKR
jgi:hypothetical protein